MLRYVVMDVHDHGDSFEEIFDSLSDAISYADLEWHIYMTPYDREHCSFYAVVSADVDDDGCINFDALDVIKRFK